MVSHTTPGCTHKAGELPAVGGRHAFYAMWRRCVQLNMWNVRTLCYLFDALVKPVLSYGCEVWAPALILKCIQGGAKRLHHEQLHQDFMRLALGVRESTPIAIIRAELGRTPLWMYWLRQCAKFWNHIVDSPEEDLTRWCMLHNCEHLEGEAPTQGMSRVQGTWASQFCQSLIELHVIGNLSDLVATEDDGTITLCYVDLDVVDSALQAWDREQQALLPSAQDPRSVASSANFKAVTYASWFAPIHGFDKHTAFTSALAIRADIVAVARMRMGAHSLNIEAQRWGSRVPRAQRLCPCCNMGSVEDEKHFFLECPLYAQARSTLYRTLGLEHLAPGPASMRSVVNGHSASGWRALASFIRAALRMRERCVVDPDTRGLSVR